MLPEGSLSTESSPERSDLGGNRGFWELRGVHWRTDLGVLPCSSSADDVRRVTANTRRRYAALRRRLLIDPLIHKDGSNFPDPVMDNPLSQDPDSMWGRFFQKAELEKMVDQDLSRLYPEHGSYFQTPGCQGMLRRILLLWCISHPNYGYRQGMHELLAPLLYVLQADVERLSAVRKLYEHYFTDNFDGLTFHDSDELETQDDQVKFHNLEELDPKIQTIISFSDAYGAEGELGIVLSEKFMEHDAYCMFDALMNGSGGAVSMASFFSPSNGPQNGLPPVIEASSALYQLLAVVDSSLYTHFVELGVEPQYFALRWLRVLFGREFALEDLLVIWDAIFSFDNSKLNSENDNETNFEALNSSRGAFIASLAVSMILYIRSSILATETATSCLQRLLNFPKDVNLGKLLKKANSLVNDAINAMRSAPPPMYSDGFHEPVKPVTTMGFRTHSLSSDAAAPRSPLSVVRDSYWEEKWRVLHKEEEQKQTNPQKQSQRKGWSEKVKSRLLRTESDPSSSKAYGEKTGPSRRRVRRSLLDDLARQLGLEEEEETETEKAVGGNGGSEENSSIFSDPPSPIGGVNDNDNDNDNENDSEHSSVASNLLVDENDRDPEPELEPEPKPSNVADSGDAIQEVDDNGPGPVSDGPEDATTPLKGVENEESAGKSGLNLKDRIILSGKQWFWKFGKNNGDGSLEKGGDSTSSSLVGRDQKSDAASSGTDVTSKGESVNQNKICSLKNLGQSMVENLQVIESVFQQEKGETGQVDNLSKKALVDRGQMTAMAALKELRKISNILSEM
ncbi:putative Rab-GTPase-TBC domain-containing protein [Helianthus annuus]|uniref:Putative ypt/Rab-GAP domain of gyp1p superfamily protein n=1 Tax=Helianthus annuus TaxID=4232 RepID=A0A251V5A7_HELAN|nr:TBC1 domain family member 5 [Helianthus annuus]KAF5813351.1 putative Rab-GTPase-TBC domain-containing protein [Helianthus annuus]KAJ0942583.1 putative Rab-GTPase-TBC domain-containing protein [Helianthus annuus]